MERLADGFNSVQATLIYVDKKVPNNTIVRATRFDPSAETLFHARRDQEDEWWKRGQFGTTGQCYRGSELIDTRQLLALPLVQDLRRTTDLAFMLGGWYQKDAGILGGVSILRGLSADDFSDDERAILSRVFPHLRRAMAIHRRFGEAVLRGQQLESSLNAVKEAMFITDSDGRVSHFNSAATSMLRKSFGLKVYAGRLTLEDINAHRRMERALRQHASVLSH